MLGFLRNLTADFILVGGLLVCAALGIGFGILFLVFSSAWATPLIWLGLFLLAMKLVKRRAPNGD